MRCAPQSVAPSYPQRTFLKGEGGAADGRCAVWTLHELDGPVDVAALEQALSAVVARHDALRLGLVRPEGQSEFVVRPAVRVQVRRRDIRPVRPVDDDVLLGRFLCEEMARPFDLENGPLLRATYGWVGGRGPVLFLAIHHLVGDGVSLSLLHEELGAHYDAALEHAGAAAGAAAGAEPPGEVGSYARWATERIDEYESGRRAHAGTAGHPFTAALGHWRATLRDCVVVSPAADVGGSRRAVGQGIAKSVLRFTAEEHAVVRRACGQLAASPYMVGVAALACLATSGDAATERRAVLGIRANRSAPGTDRIIGLFAEPVVLAVDCEASAPFAEVVRRARTAVLDGLRYDQLPFVELLRRLPRFAMGLAAAPSFVFQFEAQRAALRLGATAARALTLPDDGWEGELGPARFYMPVECNLTMHDTGATYLFEASFDTALWSPARMRRLLGQLRGAVVAGSADPGMTTAELHARFEQEDLPWTS